MSLFQKATRKKSKLKIALTGPAGSGKTYSALSVAKGIGKKIALVDTENGSASLYADRFDFDAANMTPPYLTAKYLKAIDAAVQAGYDVVILDSISHAWAGEGGILRRKDALDAGGKGNSYTNWNRFTPEHEQFIAKILHAPIHVITTMRSKQEYILTDTKGKQVPKKVGMAPVQRDGVEYEFTAVFDLGMNHHCEVSKDRTGMFDGQVFQPNEELGKQLIEWINQETPEPEPPKPAVSKKPAATQPAAQKTTEAPKQNPAPQSSATTPRQQPVAEPEPRHPADFQFLFGKRKGKWASDYRKVQLEGAFLTFQEQANKKELNENGTKDYVALDRYLMEVFGEETEPSEFDQTPTGIQAGQ